VTSPARTLIDLASILSEADLERALHHAIVDRRISAGAVWARLRDAPGQGARGPAALRRLLGGPRGRVTSPLERRVAEVLRGPGLPPFRREFPVYVEGGVYYLDFAWPLFRVGVEADGRRWHSDAGSFERDRSRHNALTAAGWKVLRVTERQVRAEPGAVRERVRELLVRG
jgi:very-short-patch-repair endonuclease